jgi:hypothetical protein
VLTPKELALTAAADGKDLPSTGNGQSSGSGNALGSGSSGLGSFGSDDAIPGEPL